jgi:hypothetical protein
MKNWYAAHIVMLVKFKGGTQRRFPAWENVVLVEAKDDEEAWTKAEAIGRAECESSDATARWNGRPFTWEFAGVRRLCLCAVVADRPGDGDEATYHELEFESLATARRYAAGRSVTVRHKDVIHDMGERKRSDVAKPRRKGA